MGTAYWLIVPIMDSGGVKKDRKGGDYKFQVNGGKPSENRLKNPQVNTALRHLHCKEAIGRIKLEGKTIFNKPEIFIQNTEVSTN